MIKLRYTGQDMKSSKIKRCSDCGRFLSEDCFYWQRNKRYLAGGYLSSCCKKCSRNKKNLWREGNKRHSIEYNRQWYKDNKKYWKKI